jgi:hypothetical protein
MFSGVLKIRLLLCLFNCLTSSTPKERRGTRGKIKERKVRGKRKPNHMSAQSPWRRSPEAG